LLIWELKVLLFVEHRVPICAHKVRATLLDLAQNRELEFSGPTRRLGA
jgi:hypothetical protein